MVIQGFLSICRHRKRSRRTLAPWIPIQWGVKVGTVTGSIEGGKNGSETEGSEVIVVERAWKDIGGG